jgi:hypothetical protein
VTNSKYLDFFLDYDEAGAVPGQKKDLLASKKEEEDHQIGIIGGISNKGKDAINNMLMQTSTGFSKFLEQYFGIVNSHHYFFLALLGVITACICFCVDVMTIYLIDKKLQLIRM